MGVGTFHQESSVGVYGFGYNPRIVYQPGIQNAVDFLSRKPVTTNTPRDLVEEYVNSIIVDSLPSAVTPQELLLASECDPTLKSIKEGTGQLHQSPLQI